MKEYIDFQATLQGELLAKLRLNSKLKKHWGTTTIDDVEVFKSKFKIWPGEDTEEVKKVLRLFGMKSSDITSQSKDGITALYLRFNPNKLNTSSYNAEALATVIEREVAINEVRTFTLNYHDTSDPKKFLGWTKEQILEFFDNNYTTVMRQIGYLEARGDTVVEDTIGMYILLDNGTDFEVTALEAQVIPLPIYGRDKYTVVIDETTATIKEVTKILRYETSISITFEYKRISALNDDSPIIVEMLAENVTQRQLQLQELAISSGYDSSGWVIDTDKTKTDTIWYKDYLRTNVSKNLKSYDYHKVVLGSLDTKYDKKKTKWYKKALAIIIAAVVAYFTWDPNTALGVYGAIAVSAAAAGLTLSVAAMYFTKQGEYGGAAYVGRWAKVAGVVSLIAGITATLQNLARVATEQATAQAVEQAAISASAGGTVLTETAVQAITESVQVGLTDYLGAAGQMISNSFSTGLSGFTNKLSAVFKVVNFASGLKEQNRAKELTSLRKEVADQQEELAEMADKNLHLGNQFIKCYANNLRADNVCFEVDYLYEGDGMNIQRPSFYKATGLNIIT